MNRSRCSVMVILMLLAAVPALADDPIVDKGSSSASQAISRQQIEKLPSNGRIAMELALLVPSGDFGDVAGTGVNVDLAFTERVSPLVVLGAGGGYSFFGKKDANDIGFGETSIMIFQFGPEIAFTPFGGDNIGGPITRDKLFFFGSPRLANFSGHQKFSSGNEFNFNSTEFALNVGARYEVLLPNRNSLGFELSHNHVFTEGSSFRDAGEATWRFAFSYNMDTPTPQIELVTKNRVKTGEKSIIRPQNLEVKMSCGYPVREFYMRVGSGYGIGVATDFTLTDNLWAIAGIDYQRYSQIGPKDDNTDDKVVTTQIDFGLRYDITGFFNSATPFIQGTLSPTYYHEMHDTPQIWTEQNEWGFYYNLGWGAKRPLSDKVDIVATMEYPLIKLGFDGDGPATASVTMGLRYDF